MKGLIYQVKNIGRDKICILSFLLPIIIGLAINFISDASFTSISETSFGIVENNLIDNDIEWLQSYGNVSVFEDMDMLETAVKDPATQMIGVLKDDDRIKTILSGDELELYTIIGNTLPQIYAEGGMVSDVKVTIYPKESNNDLLKSLLIVITMVTAMFMGCTFNAMSIIGEKEDGIALINEVLPMTKKTYLIQKITLGFIGGMLSTVLTAYVCMPIEMGTFPFLIVLIVLSAFISALTGLFIGDFSSNLMSGIAYIKFIMILFLAPPILFYLAVPARSVLHILSYALPPSVSFYGLMDLLNGQTQNMGLYILVLLLHCIIWLLFYFTISKHSKKMY